MRHLFFSVILFLLMAASAVAQELPFKQYNPDIGKYAFVKSYIMGLSSFSRMADRLALEEKAVVGARSDARVIQEFIDHRTLDNTELRIAKNYLTKYLTSNNGLVRKVAVDTTVIYEKLLGMSVRERGLWQGLGRFKTTGLPRDYSEDEFGKQQVSLALQKKEVGKELIRQSLMAAKVLLSAARCDTEDCKELAISQKERDKLVKKLDEFAKGNMDWGMKPGQSTTQASVAALREVLEDPLYHSQP